MKKNPFYSAIIFCFIILFQLLDLAPAAAAPGDFLYQLGRKPLFS
jgi:hypothetical protein